MRPIKEATYNAIKSRNMTGANRFNHKVMIEGERTGYSELEAMSLVKVYDGYFMVFCERTDGKFLALMTNGNSVYLKTIESENEISVVGSGNGGTLFTTTNGSVRAKLIKLNDGKILLVIQDAGNFAASLPSSLKVYKSNNGLGTDFILVSTIFSELLDAKTEYGGNRLSVSKQLTTGEVFIIGNKYISGGVNNVIYKSTNSGEVWTQVFSETWPGYYDGRHKNVISQMCIYGDMIFATLVYDFGGVFPRGYISLNRGVTWTRNDTLFSNLPFPIKSFAVDAEGSLFYIGTPNVGNESLFKYKSNSKIYADLNNPANWEVVKNDIPGDYYYLERTLIILESGSIHVLRSGTHDFTFHREMLESKFKAQSISISKSHGGASTATIQVDNKNGVVNPRNQDGPLYKILNLNKQVQIFQGYGDDIVPSFTGIIDSINMTTFPQLATVSLRDNFKKALDQTITKAGKNVVNYAHQPIENIVTDLCNLCGLTIGYIEPTGISIEKEFNWQSYADAFQFLSDIASFEYLCDESGKFHFRRDFQPDNMQVAWSFEEGVDITNMSYSLDDNDLYNSVRVYGKSGDNIIVYNAPFLDAAQFNILPQKVLKVDATEASTMAEIKKIAQRAISTMRSRTRVIDFSAIAVPHLQTGDFIQVFESSTDTHEIYRLIGINLTMTDKTFMMNCKAYYYGDSIVPGELPDTTATQTPDPNLNLIPEMTSNTAPSGVARASSVYKDWQATYSPWRSLNGDDQDFFWDANTRVAWLEYEFPEKTIVDKYILRARELILYNKAMPKDWTFEAFDGEKWIVLDTRTEQTAWQIYEERAFLFANTTPYAKYRINITRNNGYVRTQFERLKMYYGGGS